MKRFIRAQVAALAVLVMMLGTNSCDKESMAQKKIVGTWTLEKVVGSYEVEGKLETETIWLDQIAGQTLRKFVFMADGRIELMYMYGDGSKETDTEVGTWVLEGGKLIISGTSEWDDTATFHVDEQSRKSLVLSMSVDDEQVKYYLKK